MKIRFTLTLGATTQRAFNVVHGLKTAEEVKDWLVKQNREMINEVNNDAEQLETPELDEEDEE